MSISKVLIANRGEIAVRVSRACRELGLASVAVYSEADRRAHHVGMCDEAVFLGSSTESLSYLDIDLVLGAAERSGADAVHPGYGFLAENAEFARRVEEAGLCFIGPPPAAIAEMGDKTLARKRMAAAGVPVIPGSRARESDASGILDVASTVGYPVLLKAVAGGGGKGMRAVERPEDMLSAYEAARREAGQAFGDDRVYLEKFMENPRHIEVQVLADRHGTVIHLGERECSIQRRHQKLIEEAPAPGLDARLRDRLGEVACAVARAVEYEGAGTVEFLVEDGEFYFLEMNTRIQVEHPVTELVTGVDLVQWQLRIAGGEELPPDLGRAGTVGHALECRISGEDPLAGFLPSTGVVRHLELPAGPGVRWDGGITVGSEVGLDYDPLLGKLIVHAADRSEAVDRMRRALREMNLDGIRTTIPFHLAVMEEEDFRSGDLSIRYVEQHPHILEGPGEWATLAAIAVAALREHEVRSMAASPAGGAAGPTGARHRSGWQRRFEVEE